jgi:peptide chain release factor 1
MAEYALLEKYESIRHRFEEVQQQITDPEVISDMKRYVRLNQEYKSLEKLLERFQRIQKPGGYHPFGKRDSG